MSDVMEREDQLSPAPETEVQTEPQAEPAARAGLPTPVELWRKMPRKKRRPSVRRVILLLVAAAAATGGDVVITDAIPYHMESLSAKLLEMGVYVHDEDDRIHVRGEGLLRGINVKTQYYPGFPTDLQQPMVSLLSIAGGTSVVTENIYEARFRYVDELRRMGANIRIVDRVAIVDGTDRLMSAPVTATDLRAGAALIVAGLIAEGTTEIANSHFIRRGYEKIDEKLRHLGAQVEWYTREVPD